MDNNARKPVFKSCTITEKDYTKPNKTCDMNSKSTAKHCITSCFFKAKTKAMKVATNIVILNYSKRLRIVEL